MKTHVWKFTSNNGEAYEDYSEAFCVGFADTEEQALKRGLEQAKKEYGAIYQHDPEVSVVKYDVDVPPDVPVSLELRLKVDYKLNGETIDTAKEMLRQLVTHATNNGLLTGETALEVDNYKLELFG